VLSSLAGAYRAPQDRSGRERAAPAPLSEVRRTLGSFLELLRRQGVILRELALNPGTRREIESRIEGATRRLPATMESQVYGTPMTPRRFMESVAGLLGLHREAILRVAREQSEGPGEIERVLVLAPVPEGEGYDDAELTEAVMEAATAHSEAERLMAAQLDESLRGAA